MVPYLLSCHISVEKEGRPIKNDPSIKKSKQGLLLFSENQLLKQIQLVGPFVPMAFEPGQIKEVHANHLRECRMSLVIPAGIVFIKNAKQSDLEDFIEGLKKVDCYFHRNQVKRQSLPGSADIILKPGQALPKMSTRSGLRLGAEIKRSSVGGGRPSLEGRLPEDSPAVKRIKRDRPVFNKIMPWDMCLRIVKYLDDPRFLRETCKRFIRIHRAIQYHLDLENLECPQLFHQLMIQHTNLRSLKLGCTKNINLKDVFQPRQFPANLKVLSLRGSQIKNTSFQTLLKLSPKLEALDLVDTQIDDSGVVNLLRELPSLETLVLGVKKKKSKFSRLVLSLICGKPLSRRQPQVHQLSLQTFYQIGPKKAPSSPIKALICANLSEKLQDIHLLSGYAQQLEHLDLGGSLDSNSQLVDLFKHAFPRLTKLNLAKNTCVDDKVMALISLNCPNLAELDVSQTSLTWRGVRDLDALKNLRALKVSHLTFGDRVVVQLLRALPLLELLDLSHNRELLCFHQDPAFFIRSRSLRMVALSGTNFSADSLDVPRIRAAQDLAFEVTFSSNLELFWKDPPHCEIWDQAPYLNSEEEQNLRIHSQQLLGSPNSNQKKDPLKAAIHKFLSGDSDDLLHSRVYQEARTHFKAQKSQKYNTKQTYLDFF